MKMSQAFPSKWLQASDLQGRDITVTIEDVHMEQVGQPPENCPVVFFRGAGKALVLNKTNGQTIADQHGDDTDYWRGKQITLFPTSTDFQGRQVACIRVRPGGFNKPVNGALPTTPPPVAHIAEDPLDSDAIPF